MPQVRVRVLISPSSRIVSKSVLSFDRRWYHRGDLQIRHGIYLSVRVKHLVRGAIRHAEFQTERPLPLALEFLAGIALGVSASSGCAGRIGFAVCRGTIALQNQSPNKTMAVKVPFSKTSERSQYSGENEPCQLTHFQK